MGPGERRLQSMLAALEGARRLLILTHDNPDPDSIASGWALGAIVRRTLGLPSVLAYEGVVGRAENRAMVELLKIPLVRLSEVPEGWCDATALVDAQPGCGNNSLPAGSVPRLVIDHHPLRPATRRAAWADVRPGYGATATLLTEYLQAAGLTIGRRLATALFYAIRSETQNLVRDCTAADLQAFLRLFPAADNRTIGRIEHAPISRRYLAILSTAFRSTRLHGELSITRLDDLPYPDAVAELADLLLRIDQVTWALVMGRFGGDLFVSLRTEAARGNAGHAIAAIIGELGKAGGHGRMAGGRIALRTAGLSQERVMDDISRRARRMLGHDVRGRRLFVDGCPQVPRARGGD